MPSVYCTQCGHANPEDARFCSNCGTPLKRAEQPRPDQPRTDQIADTTTTISISGIEAYEGETGEAMIADTGAVEALRPDTALLVVLRGPNAGSRFLLDTDLTTAGRHPESDIFLDDITVSRRHAEFYRRGGAFLVRDVGSLNGTYVNRERIEEVPLTGGDEVQIGKFRLVFLARPQGGAGGP
ncbi:FHA domain-containing protein [Bailinhaonella thermotolerans]|uniref:FHA domain-containing protein n=1 Tax=Bailinhaonella thermotolerans TaxID=1070861 RepID=A0A3A4A2F1_9ACTN|nr:FHA domain-containing protein [Bailinhaonella thermotolerans]RJL20829.1 FHA domain-containing protein [Bailinhaonella thermotolerans]